MQILSIYTRKIYEKDGQKKVQWYKVGILKENDNGRKFIKLFSQPNDDFFIVDNNEKNEEEKESEVEQS
jgi:hypothetical protein